MFRMRSQLALNLLANAMSAATAVSAATAATGLRGHYYDDIGFTWLKCSQTDAAVDFDWGTAGPGCGVGADSYSVRWTGTVEPRYTEQYTFSVWSADGVRLYIGGPCGSTATDLVATPCAVRRCTKSRHPS
jgi:hypothetical protein